MWKRFVSWLRGTRLGTWSATNPLKATVAVCVAFAVLASAFGALIPWPFVQNVASDLVGGLLAGLVIFGLVNIAFGFTERRKSERHAVRIVYDILLWELEDNKSELQRIAKVLEEGSLIDSDPVFWEAERLKAEAWQLFRPESVGRAC